MAHGLPAVLVLLLVQVLQSRRPVRELLDRVPLPGRWAVYAATVFAIVLFGVDGGSQFIYFQF